MYKVCVNSARDLSVTSRDVLTSKACPDNGRTGFPSPFPTATPGGAVASSGLIGAGGGDVTPAIDRPLGELVFSSGFEAGWPTVSEEGVQVSLENGGYAGARPDTRVGIFAGVGYHLYPLNTYLRNNLPDYCGIQKDPPRGDIIYLYRAYFDCPVDPDTVEDKYKCIFLPSDTDFNFCWTDVVKDFDGFDKFTDVLIADIDLDEVERIRKSIPVLEIRK